MKMWDYVVFGKSKPTQQRKAILQPGGVKPARPPASKAEQKQLNWQRFNNLGLNEELDTLSRPSQKVEIAVQPSMRG